jgi:hypothetical protein
LPLLAMKLRREPNSIETMSCPKGHDVPIERVFVPIHWAFVPMQPLGERGFARKSVGIAVVSLT